MSKKDKTDDSDNENENCETSFNVPTIGVPGWTPQQLSRSNFFDGKNLKLPKVKSYWQALEDGETNS